MWRQELYFFVHGFIPIGPNIATIGGSPRAWLCISGAGVGWGALECLSQVISKTTRPP